MKRGNLVAAAAFAALAIYVIWESSSFPGSKKSTPGPAVFPTAVAVLMLMATLSLVITSLRMPPGEDRPLGLLTRDSARVYICMAVLVVYILLVPMLGFCAASALMLFGLIKWFGRYRFHVCALSAMLLAGIVYFVFSEILLVPMRFENALLL